MQFLQWIQLLVAIYLVQNLFLREELSANLCLHRDGRLQPGDTDKLRAEQRME